MKNLFLALSFAAGSFSVLAQKNTSCSIVIKGMDSTVTTAVLAAVSAIEMKDSTACNAKILSFELVFPKAGENHKLSSASAAFTPLMKKNLKGLKAGDKFYIKNIKAQELNDKKKEKTLDDAKFTVKG